MVMQYIIYFIVPFVLSLILTPVVRYFALRNGLVAFPRPDRWHREPTAILGGIGIYFAFIATVVFIFPGHFQNKIGFFCGATFLFLVGLADDKFHFKPYTKLFTQILAGCIAIYFGIILKLPFDNFILIPLTLLWIVGVTNSFNLLDNIDGLAAGIAGISSLMLFFSSQLFSNNPLGLFALALSGAAFGFLPYNFNPAKIFMGDSGSMFLGFSLAVISISGTPRHLSNLLTAIFVPVLILCVPIFDTLFVMILRTINGKKIYEGGKDHTSHHLVTLGLTPRKTVFLLYAISISFSLIAISYSRLNMFIISIIAFLAIVILLFLGIFLSDSASASSKNKYDKNFHNFNNTLLNAVILHKRRAVEVLLDLGLICISYSSAYFLRFDGTSLAVNLSLTRESLVWIIIIKMSVFFAFGLYRGVWRYISISDLFTIFKVVSLASVASVLFLTFAFRFADYSRAVFFLDWILLLFLVCASRISFRALGEFFSRARVKGMNVLIYGAGDTGEMVIREIKRNKALNYNPVGFIDDDPVKSGNRIQGITVLGSREEMKFLVSANDVKELLVAVPSMDVASFSEIVKLCRECGISYRRVKGILDYDVDEKFAQG